KVAGAMAAVELGFEDAVPACATGAGGTGQAKNDRMVGQTTKGPRLNGRRADLVCRYASELLAKTVNGFVQQGRYRLRSTVPLVESGSPGDDYNVDGRIGKPLGHQGANQINVVGKNAPGYQPGAGFNGTVLQELPGGVLVSCACVRNRQYGDVQWLEFAGSMTAHGKPPDGADESYRSSIRIHGADGK